MAEVLLISKKPLGIKLPPYFDIVHFDQAAAIFNKYPLKFVNCVNSIGNGLYIEDESVVIRPKMALEYRRSVHQADGSANVHAFLPTPETRNPNHRTGGVLTGRDAFEYILCGASMVQVGTTLHKEGVAASRSPQNSRLLWKKKRGYESLEDFRGKIEVY